MDPTAAYDILYRGMSDGDREKLTTDIGEFVDNAGKLANKALLEGVQKAVTSIYNEVLVANIWSEMLRDNSSSYEFLKAIQTQIEKKIMDTNPKNLSSYWVEGIANNWRNKYPAEWREIVGRETAARLKKLEEWEAVANL